MNVYYEILLPIKLNWTPTYSFEEELSVGERVSVSFAHRNYVGVVLGPSGAPDISADRIQAVSGRIDCLPPVTDRELVLWKFISEYYLCSLGEVYKAAYPKARTESEMILARKKAKSATSVKEVPYQGKHPVCHKPQVLISGERINTYIREIAAVLDNGGSALVLIPEKTFGDKLQKTLKAEFGDRFRTWNSGHTAAQRRETAEMLRAGQSVVVLGARSSIFLPFSNLDLIVIDEEQDSSHKQTEPNPRYNGRDAAVILGTLHGAKVILGTSSPSFETIFNLSNGKYTSHPESSPTVPVRLPETIDISAEKRKHGIDGDFTYKLIDAIKSTTGKVLLIRGWENEEELGTRVEVLFPGKDITILTPTAARASSGHFELIAIMQSDALSDKADFRADEKTLQFFSCISGKCDRLIVQTTRPEHPAFSLSQNDGRSALLEERKIFNLPPFSRIIDVVLKDENRKRCDMFSGILSGSLRGAARVQREDGVSFRITVPHTSEASPLKKRIFSTVTDIEKRYRYTGHIHIDVDPA